MKKIAVVAAKGLGDGLIFHVLSHNFHLQGCSVTTFNTPLSILSEWFPQHDLRPYPKAENMDAAMQMALEPYDEIIVADQSLLSFTGPLLFPNKLSVLKKSSFDLKTTFVENLAQFCAKRFKLTEPILENGITPKKGLQKNRFPKRVAIHPVSMEIGRTWPKEKFLDLAEKLSRHGYEPVFLLSAQERSEWESAPQFDSLDEMTSFIYESGFLIGNNSGLGHLASNLGISTLSLFARNSYAKFWRPGWGQNVVVTPYPILFGGKLKQKFWKTALTSNLVLNAFLRLAEEKREQVVPPSLN